mgnify:CR=1 FL=1
MSTVCFEQRGASNWLNGALARQSYHLLRFLLAGVFLWSGLSKLLQPEVFADTVGAYGLLPEFLVAPAAFGLIGLELVAAVGLLLERRGALTLTGLMLLLFVAVLSYGIFLGLDIDCGCFGPNDPEADAFHDLRGALLRDLLMIGVILYLSVWRSVNRMLPRPWFRAGLNATVLKEEKS